MTSHQRAGLPLRQRQPDGEREQQDPRRAEPAKEQDHAEHGRDEGEAVEDPAGRRQPQRERRERHSRPCRPAAVPRLVREMPRVQVPGEVVVGFGRVTREETLKIRRRQVARVLVEERLVRARLLGHKDVYET